MQKCELTGKGKQFGNNVSFSQRHTKKVWKPNLQTKTVTVDGRKVPDSAARLDRLFNDPPANPSSYLTQLKQEGATLVLLPGNGRASELLFLPRCNAAAIP